MERLTDDLLTKIFGRLPARSIIRSRCVSKSWNTLITNDGRKLPQPMAGLFYHHYLPSGTAFATIGIPIDDADLSFLPSHKSLEILDICNGLLLIFLRQSDDLFHYAVCNPATRSWAMLPQPGKHVHVFALGFAPHLSIHFTVLGYNPGRDEPAAKFEVFVSETDDWVDGPEITNDDNLQIFSSVYLNGIFYLLNALSSSPVHSIVGVDLHGVVCCKIQLPCHVPNTLAQIHGLSDGLLHFAAILDDEMLVWALDDVYDSDNWVLKHSIHLGAVLEKVQNIEMFRSSVNRRYKLVDESRLQMFHPDLNVIFLTLGNALLSFDFTSADLEVVCSLRGKLQAVFFPYSPCYLEELDL